MTDLQSIVISVGCVVFWCSMFPDRLLRSFGLAIGSNLVIVAVLSALFRHLPR